MLEEIIFEDDSDPFAEIHESVFSADFDEAGWDPEVVDDSDEEAAEMFGY